MANTLQGEAQILARATAGTTLDWNGDIMSALRITLPYVNGPMREVLNGIPGGLMELLRNPSAYLSGGAAAPSLDFSVVNNSMYVSLL